GYFSERPSHPLTRGSTSYHSYHSSYDRVPRSDIIKVAIYDGKTSWRDFLSQFEMAAHANRWDRNTRAVRLACNLRGSAQALLSDLTLEVKYDYDRLVAALTNRFEPENQCDIYKAQIKQRMRKKDEPLTELAQDITRLTRMAYPSAVQDLRDTLAKDCFVEALNDAELEMFVCQKEPETLEEAVRVALKYEAFSHSRCKRLMTSKSSVRMQHESSDVESVSGGDIREIKAALSEIKQANKSQINPDQNVRDTRRCFICNENTHLRRNCPFNPYNNTRNNSNNYGPPSLLGNYPGSQPPNWNGPFNVRAGMNNQSAVNTGNSGRNFYRDSRRYRNQENRQ
ncbi:MAG: hypothetical protein JAZ03_18850, partial [Candidatus Thiodiazotropha taylori]|nr:hypothetical protein [Candidatus Thiodiazotropha taylori]MCW4335988.1 hypothetical protein [Candidatus Thiodiazotropha endolucinida]